MKEAVIVVGGLCLLWIIISVILIVLMDLYNAWKIKEDVKNG